MKFFQEFFIILFFSVLGEGVRILTHLPVPGSILGILFLFLAFEMKVLNPEKIGKTGDFLLNNLTILFVPAGVGLLDYFGDIAAIWPVLLGAVVVCSIATLAITGKTAELVEYILLRVRAKKEVEEEEFE
ncbi:MULTISPECIES: CidA/LrgA family protein [unclassified Enterococcus]|uniref:CidA/LrgA family protein n=1 Tax=unclassified Enterococcus TaxID=2608891 RepID=UPI0004204218